ncbi:MAG: type I-E CRISPR-associated protein Cas6/Cse3/CasE [Pseudomonadota bacterium]
MYLSRLLLTGEKLHNPYEIHRSIWQAFPEAPEQDRDFLFRIEKRASCKAQVLIQSHRQPLEGLEGIRLLATKRLKLELPEVGSRLHFYLIANPIKTIKDEHGRLDRNGEVKKCRVPLIKEGDQVEWLKRKLAKAATVEMLEIDKQLPLNFRKNKHLGKIQTYAFRGNLRIQSSEQLCECILHGVGPAKAFGCGLLSLARA